MNIETFRKHCMSLQGVEETLPFGPDTLVYKVYGKVFALTGLDEAEFSVNLKCDPDRAIDLRDEYPDAVLPGWHMNKKHWNTVYFEGRIADKLLLELIDHSYKLVISGLPLSLKKQLLD
ncbi:MAG: MmcQ/YjbR family DNA-binding protein [Saprospiraceae bacterium]